MASDTKALEAQIALAMAALGVAFAQTLAADDTPPRVLANLRMKADGLYRHLQEIDSPQAAMMFGAFVRALRDPKLLPRVND